MIVLVTGASGFVGSALMSSLSAHPDVVPRAAVRCENRKLSSMVDTVQVGSLSSDTDWCAALQGVDAVVHTAARVHVMQDTAESPLLEFRRVNVDGTLNLAQQAAHSGVKRFIFVSSIKVNGESTQSDKFFYADDSPAPMDPYGISKREAEEGLRKIESETGMEVVILRPPLVYGPGVKANFLKLLNLAQRGIPLPFGSIENRRSMVYVGNLVSAIMLCVKHPKAAGETFLVSDGADVSTAELVRKMTSAMGRKATLLSIPSVILKAMGLLTGKRSVIERLTGSLCVDSSKIREMLDWQPPYTLEQGIQETVDWYLEHC